ncbi:MAG: hypothetical protein EP330_00755 [Deltaproteobacteria bacterium]|nr:MAG: hypothetical protein EP330_00755 [Deltaproteobacteria bacterium]
MLLLLSAALAAPPGFVLRGHDGDCDLFLGEELPEGVPMRAECAWQEASPEQLAAVLDDPMSQLAFGRVAAVEILGEKDGVFDVWQHHLVSVIADREVRVSWARVDAECPRWEWSPLPLDEPRMAGNVPADHWSGFWEVCPATRGARVTMQSVYDAGDFPGWLIRPFLTGKLADSASDLRRAVR